MSWLYSRALVEEYLGENFLDGEQFVPSNGNHTQQAFCAPDKMMDFSRLSQFGMTYKPLTENLGEELLMLYRAGFHAKTFRRPEKEKELKANEVECGHTWRGWLAKYSPDLCLWKTPQCSLLGEEQESLQTLPRWGMTVDGLLWEQPTLAPLTKEKECGLLQNWPTPDANCGKRGTQPKWEPIRKSGQPAQYTINQAVRDMEKNNGGNLNPMWIEWLMGWPLGWTDLKPLEMDKCLYVQQPHGNGLSNE